MGVIYYPGEGAAIVWSNLEVAHVTRHRIEWTSRTANPPKHELMSLAVRVRDILAANDPSPKRAIQHAAEMVGARFALEELVRLTAAEEVIEKNTRCLAEVLKHEIQTLHSRSGIRIYKPIHQCFSIY